MLCPTSVIDRVLPTVRLSPHPGVYAVAHPRDTGGRVRTNKPAVGTGELYAPAPKLPRITSVALGTMQLLLGATVQDQIRSLASTRRRFMTRSRIST